jgi:hypothetical protein
MSENTAQTITTADGTTATLDGELLKQLLALKAKDDERVAKANKAKEDRKRTNARGTMPDGVTERNATQALYAAAGAVVQNWVESYREDPAQALVRMETQLVPMLVGLSNTPSISMAGAQDGKRHEMGAWYAPHAATQENKPAETAKSSK